MSRNRNRKNKNHQGPHFPDGHYKLENISIKEIMNKYPDKVMDAVDRKKDTVLVMDTCKIVFRKKRSE